MFRVAASCATIVSIKWLDPVTEKDDDEDDFHSGCFYFDPTQRQLDPVDMVTMIESSSSDTTISK